MGYTGKEARYNGDKKKSRKLSRKVVYTDIRAERDEFLDRFSCLSEKSIRHISGKEKLFWERRRHLDT